MRPSLRLTGPLPPDRGNARGHWAAHHRQRRSYWAALDVHALAQRFRLKAPLARANVAIDLRTWNPMDPDNLAARCKYLLDWLVTRGYLVDDSPRTITLTVTQRVDRTNRGATVTLTPGDPAP